MIYSNSSETEWHTIGDALPVFDSWDGSVHLVFTRDNREALLSRSVDQGATWSEPRDISRSLVRRPGSFLGTGHDHGLQLRSGRLLVPMYGGGTGPFVACSDDHGASWHIAGQVPTSPTEWVMAEARERGGSELVASLRSELGRLMSWSSDGGDTWTPPKRAPGLPEPVGGCEGAMFLHPDGRLYYSHPDRHLLREVMMVKVSEDQGRSWSDHRMIWGPGHGCDEPCVPAASYSSMAPLGEGPDSRVGIFYMRNNASRLIFEGRGASFTTFEARQSEREVLV